MTAKYSYTLHCDSDTGCDATFTCHSNRADFTRLEAARINNGKGWRWIWRQAERHQGPGLSKDLCPDHRDEAGNENGKPLSNISTDLRTDKITTFSGSYRFLSNFYKSAIQYQGEEYPTLEHAFQAAKCANPIDRHRIRMAATASNAKRLGRQILMRGDWPTARIRVMKELLQIKFKVPLLRKQLLLTGTMELVEGNTWNDQFWGVCNGVGENHLGKLLMEVRSEIVATEIDKAVEQLRQV